MIAGEIAEKVRQLLQEHLNVAPTQLIDTALLGKDLGADSLDYVEITIDLEQEFDIFLVDAEIVGIRTVADLIGLVERKLQSDGTQEPLAAASHLVEACDEGG